MGIRARFTVASVVSLAAAGMAVFGCDEGPKYDPAYPIEGGPTTRPTKDVEVPIEPEPEPEPDAALDASCAPVGTPADIMNVPSDPDLMVNGGLVPDGTYVLTGGFFADATKDGGVAFKRAAQMTFSGKNLVWTFDTDLDGKPSAKCCAGTWVYQAGEAVMAMNMTCNGQQELFDELYELHPMGLPDGGSDAGKPQIMFHLGSLHDVYTKQ